MHLPCNLEILPSESEENYQVTFGVKLPNMMGRSKAEMLLNEPNSDKIYNNCMHQCHVFYNYQQSYIYINTGTVSDIVHVRARIETNFNFVSKIKTNFNFCPKAVTSHTQKIRPSLN